MNYLDLLMKKHPDADLNVKRMKNGCMVKLSWEIGDQFRTTAISVVRVNTEEAAEALLNMERI